MYVMKCSIWIRNHIFIDYLVQKVTAHIILGKENRTQNDIFLMIPILRKNKSPQATEAQRKRFKKTKMFILQSKGCGIERQPPPKRT